MKEHPTQDAPVAQWRLPSHHRVSRLELCGIWTVSFILYGLFSYLDLGVPRHSSAMATAIHILANAGVVPVDFHLGVPRHQSIKQ